MVAHPFLSIINNFKMYDIKNTANTGSIWWYWCSYRCHKFYWQWWQYGTEVMTHLWQFWHFSFPTYNKWTKFEWRSCCCCCWRVTTKDKRLNNFELVLTYSNLKCNLQFDDALKNVQYQLPCHLTNSLTAIKIGLYSENSHASLLVIFIFQIQH